MKLSLHRARREPDWFAVPDADRNVWQRVAARTHGVLTPGNAITLAGFGFSVWGVILLTVGLPWWALGLLAVGRLFDIADGLVADRTGTKSPLGEILDAMMDKLIIAVAVAGMYVAQVAPVWVLTLFILPHVIIVAITFYDRALGIQLHPSRLGKTATLIAWLAVPLLLIDFALQLQAPAPFGIVTLTLVLVSSAFGFATAVSYARVKRVDALPPRGSAHDR